MLDLGYAFYLGATLEDDDHIHGKGFSRRAIETIAKEMDCPSLITARETAIKALATRNATATEISVTSEGSVFGWMNCSRLVTQYDENAERNFDDAMRVYGGLFASLEAAWGKSDAGIKYAMDSGI
jgi:hypothetical protein